ncbi:Dipeptidyl-peptidase_I [Hexamita inflata]|uniref:Dipeptidyl-peptidase I n=1 Tax=Hexamita inflata TaxID=28002 RepID=A0AA86QS32_9EUKA|nr:Dipeptidyl-peptidase I [Hexamita inflata]
MIILCYLIADTPATCFSDQVLGEWQISFSKPKQVEQPYEINCENQKFNHLTKKIILQAPNIAIDKNGVYGTWAFAYTQAVQIIIDGLDIMWYVNFEETDAGVFSNCSKSQVAQGWAHTQGLSNKKHYCIEAQNINPTISNTTNYKEYEEEVLLNHKMPIKSLQKSQLVSKSVNYSGSSLPKSFDWRNVNGKSYIPKVVDQHWQLCGSCYICATLHMMMSRIMIKRNTPGVYPKLSIQQLVDCNFYSQGCLGGFPEHVGRFAENFGITTDEVYGAYQSGEGKCKSVPNENKYYFTATQALGGYLGAVTDPVEMQHEILRYGPVAVSVMDDDLFDAYDPYGRTLAPNETDSDNPERHYLYSEVNHLVLLIGWVTEEVLVDNKLVNETFWILHNSFGGEWGPDKDGTMKVVMGRNAYGIESNPVTTYFVEDFQFQKEKKNVEMYFTSTVVLAVLCGLFGIAAALFACFYFKSSTYVKIEVEIGEK